MNNIIKYFTDKYNTNNLNTVIRFNHDNGGFTDYSIKEAIKDFDDELKWFFDMLPNDKRTFNNAFNITKDFFNKHLSIY